jgi:hypothetical protein
MRRSLLVPVLLVLGAACGSDSSGPGSSTGFCVRSDITLGGTVNGTLASTDCDLANLDPNNAGYFESYSLTVTADTIVGIDLTSGEFDTFLVLLRIVSPDSFVVVAVNDDDDGATTNSRIDAVQVRAGEDYLVLANGFDYADVGAYTLTVVGRTLTDLLCIRGAIALGGTVNGNLATTDCDLGNSYFESFTLNVVADVSVNIAMTSTAFDTFLFLLRLVGSDSVVVVATNDDGGGGTNSLIGGATVLAANDYLVIANGFAYADVGDYTLTVNPAAGAILGRAPSAGQPWRSLVKEKRGEAAGP